MRTAIIARHNSTNHRCQQTRLVYSTFTMAGFGELVLVLGDLHIPQRANAIPEKFKRMLVPNKMQHVLCTGNIGREQYDELVTLAPNVHVVQGDYNTPEANDGGLQFPDHTVCQVGQFRIGIVHGHQLLPWNSQDALCRMRQKLQVDILISGHSHQNQVQVVDGYYYLNPGSITGAYSANQEDITPSFILLAVTDNKLVCYVYELLKDQVEVSKTEFTKKEGGANANPALLQSLLS